jgi:hypothetical protein
MDISERVTLAQHKGKARVAGRYMYNSQHKNPCPELMVNKDETIDRRHLLRADVAAQVLLLV